MDTFYSIVFRIFKDIFAFRQQETQFDQGIRLCEDLHMQPLHLLELLLTLSAVFDVPIAKNDALKFRNVGNIYRFITDHVPPEQITACAYRFENMNYVNIFSAMAWKLGILSDEIVDTLEEFFGLKMGNRGLDISGIKIKTLYLMQNVAGGCKANCAFCIQSRDSNCDRKEKMLLDLKLCRLPIPTLARHLRGGLLESKGIERICIQTVYNPNTIDNLIGLVSSLNAISSVPMTACAIPVSRENMVKLKEAGLDMITINYETATPELFFRLRGPARQSPYTWDKVTAAMDHALEVFGKGKVGSHLQVGLGETQWDILSRIQELKDKNVLVSLYAFKPLPGTALEKWERVSYEYFHRIQMGSYLIQNGICRLDDFVFDQNGFVVEYGLDKLALNELIHSGIPFMNKGCPGCNRVFVETLPGERFYSYPRELTEDEITCIERAFSINEDVRAHDLAATSS